MLGHSPGGMSLISISEVPNGTRPPAAGGSEEAGGQLCACPRRHCLCRAMPAGIAAVLQRCSAVTAGGRGSGAEEPWQAAVLTLELVSRNGVLNFIAHRVGVGQLRGGERSGCVGHVVCGAHSLRVAHMPQRKSPPRLPRRQTASGNLCAASTSGATHNHGAGADLQNGKGQGDTRWAGQRGQRAQLHSSSGWGRGGWGGVGGVTVGVCVCVRGGGLRVGGSVRWRRAGAKAKLYQPAAPTHGRGPHVVPGLGRTSPASSGTEPGPVTSRLRVGLRGHEVGGAESNTSPGGRGTARVGGGGMRACLCVVDHVHGGGGGGGGGKTHCT